MTDELTPEERAARLRCLELFRALGKTPLGNGNGGRTPEWPAGVIVDGSSYAPFSPSSYARQGRDEDVADDVKGFSFDTWVNYLTALTREAVDTVEAMEEAALKCRMAAERVRRATGER